MADLTIPVTVHIADSEVLQRLLFVQGSGFVVPAARDISAAWQQIALAVNRAPCDTNAVLAKVAERLGFVPRPLTDDVFIKPDPFNAHLRDTSVQHVAEKFYSWMSLDGRTSVLVLAVSREDAISICERFFSTPKTVPVDGEDRALVVNMDVIQVDEVHDKMKPFADELRKSGRVALIGLAAVH